MNKKIIEILKVFVVSIFGGLFAQQMVWPLLLQSPLFSQYKQDDAPIYMTELKEVFIQENTALEVAIEQVEGSVIGIRTITEANSVLEGSGLIVTSDGLAVILAELVPLGSDFSVYIDNSLVSAQVLKRDLTENLALIKIDQNNLSTVSFVDADKIKLGERVFLLGVTLKDGEVNKMVNEGSVRFLNEDLIETNMFDGQSSLGSPLFNIEGKFLGLNFLNVDGRIITLPIGKIKTFTGF